MYSSGAAIGTVDFCHEIDRWSKRRLPGGGMTDQDWRKREESEREWTGFLTKENRDRDLKREP